MKQFLILVIISEISDVVPDRYAEFAEILRQLIKQQVLVLWNKIF